MSSPYTVTPVTCDEAYSALIGNGQLGSTVSPTGYHVAPGQPPATAHRTQFFVWSGRRSPGPQHPLLAFGRVWRALEIDGAPSTDLDWQQEVDPLGGCVRSRLDHGTISEHTLSFLALQENCFLSETTLTADNMEGLPVCLRLTIVPPSVDWVSEPEVLPDGLVWHYHAGDEMGCVRFAADLVEGDGTVTREACVDRGAFRCSASIARGVPVRVRVLIQFSDRLSYAFPRHLGDWDAIATTHAHAWDEFHARSSVVTSVPNVDAARALGLYTLRCQATPWSIPPTLSEPYWGAGAFHDEMYPFYALQSANHSELALRPLMFRLATLPRAVERAVGRGALYPWSSTECGEERDPDGLWLTERFHLGQFSAEVWARWLYEGLAEELDDLYPVLKEIARYYVAEVVCTDAAGRAQTVPCVDFDESVGPVTNGPFTVSAASSALLWAAEAADQLGVDRARALGWRRLAHALLAALPGSGTAENECFGIPDGQPLHYSTLGPIFPFRLEVGTPRARRSAEHIHAVCRSSRGWKPGMSNAFTGSSWMWTAGHLAVVHAMHADPERAWEAIEDGVSGCGPGLMPCEHIDRNDRVVVPWFTTGVATWLYGLHALFVWIDDYATHLLDGWPRDVGSVEFTSLCGAAGVRVSGSVRDGSIVRLVAAAGRRQAWRYTVPRRWADGASLVGRALGSSTTHELREIVLQAEVPTSLVAN